MPPAVLDEDRQVAAAASFEHVAAVAEAPANGSGSVLVVDDEQAGDVTAHRAAPGVELDEAPERWSTRDRVRADTLR